MGVTVLCPSRGNPAALQEAAASCWTTATNDQTRFVAVVDATDPDLPLYEAIENAELLIVPPERCGTMNLALNYAAPIEAARSRIVGFIGDDHRFRTRSWDQVIEKAMDEYNGGFAYGNDLFMGDRLPTQVFMRSEIILELGWMGLPGARHLYLDNTWKWLGDATESLLYLPDVVIEHMHPAAGKASWDPNHQRVNTVDMYSHDGQVYAAWLEREAPLDVERVRRALG